MKRILAVLLTLSLMMGLGVPVWADTAADAANPADPIRVACIGDSITQGIGSTNLRDNTYPAHLQQFLGTKNYLVGNFGSSARTAIKDAGNDVYVPFWEDGNFQKSKDFAPNVVIMMLGTNDVMCTTWDVNAYYWGVRGLIEEYQALDSKPTIYVCTPMSAFDTAHPAKLAEGIPYLKQAVADTGVNLVEVNDLTADWFDKNYLNGGDDCVHPNDAGYLAFAQLLYRQVFQGQVVTMTVTADHGCTVSLGGQSVKESGQLLTGWDGTDKDVKELVVEKDGVGLMKVEVPMGKDPTVDLRGAVIPQNLAYKATAVNGQNLGATLKNVNDGNKGSGWQPSWNAAYTDMWVGYDFGENAVFDRVNILWEEATRAPEGAYTVEVSNDGTSWMALEGAAYRYGAREDTVLLPTVSARFVRVKITKGSNNLWRPQIYELRVLLSGEPFTPTVTYAQGPEDKGDGRDNGEDGKGNGLLWYILGGLGLALAAGLTAVLVIRKKKQ